MILLDGESLAKKIISSLKVKPNTQLNIIQVGDDPSSTKYTSLKQQKAQSIGINFLLHHLPHTSSTANVIQIINQLNDDPVVTGLMVQLPLPSQIDKKTILSSINPRKDIDGLNPNSGITPAVVTGIITLLTHYQISFTGKNIVIINDSDLIGQPLKKYFGQATLCNDQTKNLSAVTQSADILISATGVNNLITAHMVKKGAVVVDVANGDVDFAAVSPKCSYITPTFGGVGPMTIASLLQNLVTISHENPAF